MRFEFGEFSFDVAGQDLKRRGSTVHVTPKAMQLLELLIAKRGEVVRRQDLVDSLWPDVIVSEASLKNLVALLRTALDDAGRDGRFIRTIHGRGYSFTGDVLEVGKPLEASRVKLWLADRWFSLSNGANIVGRDPDCDIVLDHPSVSRHHARISIMPDEIIVEDLQSKNGTRVGDLRVHEPTSLKGPARVTFGKVAAKLAAVHETPSTDSVSSNG